MTFSNHALPGAFAALGLALTVTAAPALAQSTGMALASHERCAVQVYLTNSSAQVIGKAAPGISGSYVMTAYQGLPVNDSDAAMTGRFNASGNRDTVLARTNFGLGFVRQGGFRGMDELRDAEYGQDAALHVDLAVFDQRGRLICRTQSPAIYPIAVLEGPAVTPSTYQPPVAAPYRGPAAAVQPARAPRPSHLERSRRFRAMQAARRDN